MSPTLVDTGFIVALLDRSERNHQRCKEVLKSVSGALVTCEAMIAEACHLLREPVPALMKRYARVPMDFADACLVSLADTFSTGRILTLDSDFHVYRWRRTRAFELLID